MIVNIAELEKGNGELYMLHENLDLTIMPGLEKTPSAHSGQVQFPLGQEPRQAIHQVKF